MASAVATVKPTPSVRPADRVNNAAQRFRTRTLSAERLRTLEVSLVIITLGLACLLHEITGYKMVVLNLFYLPAVLAAFFLGRYRAGVLALLSVILASVVIATDLQNFAAYTSPIAVGLAVTTWGAVLGLTTLLVGTLSDERSAKLVELQEAYVGVVEVLSRYLQSADPKLKDRSRRIAELSQSVATQLRLSDQEIDDIRIAALLQDMENLEITARVICKAMGDLRTTSGRDQHTFHGTDLAHSLGSVLHGALPLLLNHNQPADGDPFAISPPTTAHVPLGAQVLRTVRAYDALLYARQDNARLSTQDAIARLREDHDTPHHPAVLHALEQILLRSSTAEKDPAQNLDRLLAAAI